MLPERLDSHSFFWTKVPDKMRNANASNWYSVSGRDNGCTTFVGNSTGSIFDFKPPNQKVYAPKVGHFLIFSKLAKPYGLSFLCDGERRTVAGNIVLYKSKIEKNDEKYDHRVCYFNQGNPLKNGRFVKIYKPIFFLDSW